MPDLEEEEIIGGAGGFAEDDGDEFGTDINAGGADAVYEDEENAETASHLVM